MDKYKPSKISISVLRDAEDKGNVIKFKYYGDDVEGILHSHQYNIESRDLTLHILPKGKKANGNNIAPMNINCSDIKGKITILNETETLRWKLMK